ncbi:MAG: hypothetical protein KAT05_05840 [Spirochaetes bacterium]|nr:hypothetical protein [Spirochaetota bacterium]
MAITSLIDKSFKIIQNIIKALLNNIIWITFSYFYFIIALWLVVKFNSKPDPVIYYLGDLDLKILLPILLIFSILFASIKPLNKKHVKKIFSYVKQFDNYYPKIPLSLIGIGFLLMTFVIFNPLLLEIGMFLTLFGFILFYIMLVIKIYYERKIYFTLHRASESLDEISFDKNNGDYVKNFSKNFTNFLNSLDNNLDKGLKINNLRIDDTEPSKTTTENINIKNTIIHYLPLYIKFGNQEHITSLKNNINVMTNLVNEDDEFNINILNNIRDIYKNIENFLILNNFSITEQGWKTKLSFFKDRDTLYVIQTIVVIIYIILSGKLNL